jgi:hypothetical protein
MDELSSAFGLSGYDSWTWPWSCLSRDEQESLMNQLETAAKESRVYDIIQLSVRILSSDYPYNEMIRHLSRRLHIAIINFGRLNNSIQSNTIKALTEAFAVACYRGQLDDVRRLSHVVRDDVDMLGVGLHFALLQYYGRTREHWDVIKWLMDKTQLGDNPLVLRRALVEACDNNELKEVRWMLQYRQLVQDTETIDYALGYARRSRHLALVKCLVEYADVDFARIKFADTLLHDVIWWSSAFVLNDDIYSWQHLSPERRGKFK